MVNKETRTIHSSQSYWLTEYKQSIKTGDYPDVPIRLYEGFLMISYLRYLRDTDLIRRYSWHTQNAIQRKLMQYEGVEWFTPVLPVKQENHSTTSDKFTNTITRKKM